jgi:hypothetical protein
MPNQTVPFHPVYGPSYILFETSRRARFSPQIEAVCFQDFFAHCSYVVKRRCEFLAIFHDICAQIGTFLIWIQRAGLSLFFLSGWIWNLILLTSHDSYFIRRHPFFFHFYVHTVHVRGKAMANYPQELAQDAVCQSHTGHMTGLWFLPARPLRLNTNE